MEEILRKMLELSENIFEENKKRNKNKQIAPIIAIVYDPKNFKLYYSSKNNWYGWYKNQYHAEHLIFKQILKDKKIKEVKNYHLLLTCPPCSNCVNEAIKYSIRFKKIEWLTTSMGKERELENLKNKKYNNFKKISGLFKPSKNNNKLALMASFRWIEYIYYMYINKTRNNLTNRKYLENNNQNKSNLEIIK